MLSEHYMLVLLSTQTSDVLEKSCKDATVQCGNQISGQMDTVKILGCQQQTRGIKSESGGQGIAEASYSPLQCFPNAGTSSRQHHPGFYSKIFASILA